MRPAVGVNHYDDLVSLKHAANASVVSAHALALLRQDANE